MEIGPRDLVDAMGHPKRLFKLGPQESRQSWDQSKVLMSSKFMPPASEVSEREKIDVYIKEKRFIAQDYLFFRDKSLPIEAYWPRNRDAANELTNEILSVFE